MPAARPSVSAVLITRDAEAHLRECLQGLAWCEEIVLLDSGSRDATLGIAREFGAKVYVDLDWRGFGAQKNRAIARATGEWVLAIDADEVVTPELRAEIEAALATPDSNAAFQLPRRSSFCGHWMRHGGWWPDYVTRLFRQGRARYSEDLVHERLLVDGPSARLRQPLLHYTYDSLEQALAKMDRYSTLGAQQAHARGKRATPLTALLRATWAFLRTYLLRLGMLDGAAGLMLALYNAHGTYYRYLKLWLLGRAARGK
jgi:glycosyltransferase involved in cell wall biosynthesis